MANILVVDDSAVDRRFVGGLLKRQPEYSVEFAEDGSDALTKIRAQVPDVIITDLQMPNRNGLELVSAVRMHHPGVPVILMTGHGSEGLAVEALHRGAAGYVPKPQLAERLLDAVGEALSLSRADHTYERLISCLKLCEFNFELASDAALIDPLVDLVSQMVAGMRLTDATGRFRVGAAVKEALLNAIYRGNLELSFSELPDVRDGSPAGAAARLVEERRTQPPYRDRLVHVLVKINPDEARLVIRDDGPGFDPTQVPQAGEEGSLDAQTGRGLVLLRAFLDEVQYSDRGNEVTLVKRREE
ncbi:MAG TPA: response regulator [Pirellulaceae bacterium]|nr:response regulator [Pirellulaceae bacterium]